MRLYTTDCDRATLSCLLGNVADELFPLWLKSVMSCAFRVHPPVSLSIALQQLSATFRYTVFGQEITQPVRWPLFCHRRANAMEQSVWTHGCNHGWKVEGDQGLGPNTGALAGQRLGWVLGVGGGRPFRCEGMGVSPPENFW